MLSAVVLEAPCHKGRPLPCSNYYIHVPYIRAITTLTLQRRQLSVFMSSSSPPPMLAPSLPKRRLFPQPPATLHCFSPCSVPRMRCD